MRPAPARLGLDDLAPERDLTEDPANRVGLVTPAQVRQRIGRIPSRVKAAIADASGDWMRVERLSERILVPPALGQRRLADRPDQVVQDRAEPHPGRRLCDDPRAPADDRLGRLAE